MYKTIISKLILYMSFIAIALLLSGEGYLYYLDEELNNSDFYFYIGSNVRDPEIGSDFLVTSERLCKKYGIEIFTVSREVKGKSFVEYSVYASQNALPRIKKKTLLHENENIFFSPISGEKKVIFRKLTDFDYNSKSKEKRIDTFFMLNGTEETAEAFRGSVVNKYGISTPAENSHSRNAFMFVVFSWAILAVIIVFS